MENVAGLVTLRPATEACPHVHYPVASASCFYGFQDLHVLHDACRVSTEIAGPGPAAC